MHKKQVLITGISFVIIALLFSFSTHRPTQNDTIISYVADPQTQDVELYWKDDNGTIIKSLQNLNDYLAHKNKKLVFAMNGGMFKQGNIPVGLLVQQQKTITPLDTASGNGNFYLMPNGVFYITSNHTAGICTTTDFIHQNNQVAWATQSGPMLVINGAIHPAFKKGSANINIRNGVGVLPNNKLVFAMSTQAINFYDFAEYFKNLGCKNALYLDGFVSRMYLPEKKWVQTDGNFGVIIGITTANR